MSLPECAKGDIALQHPGAASIFKGIGAEKERLLPGHLDEAQLPLADPHATVPANRPQPFHSLSNAGSRQLYKAELRSVAEWVSGDGTPTHIHPPQPAGEVQHGLVYNHPARKRERRRQADQLLPLPCLREKPAHDEAPLPAVAVLDEVSDGIPVRRPVRAFRPSKDAERLTRHGAIVRAVNVGKAEELSAERVADDPRGSGVHVDAGRLACPSCEAAAHAGCRGTEIKEQEAVAAGGAGGSEQARDVGVVAGGSGPGVDDVGGDDEVGGVRGLGELEGRARLTSIVREIIAHEESDADAAAVESPRRRRAERARWIGSGILEERASEVAVGSAAAPADTEAEK
nr:unnamed protein product [Digitaria exilis]